MFSNRSYFRFLIRSQGRHGIHSPFVFRLVDEYLTTKVDKNFNVERKKWFQQLKKQTEQFLIEDLGVGSKKMHQSRSVRELFHKSSSRGIYGDVLYLLSKFTRPNTMLELGTSIGIGTTHLKKGMPTAHIITVEGCEKTLLKASQSFDYWKFNGITTICSSFDEFLVSPQLFQYDLVFIDGNHSGEALLHYLSHLEKCTHNDTLFIIDDIRWSEDMWSAWETICVNKKFHLTIDLGRMGLAWNRSQQVKEHFVIRPKVFKTRFF